MKKTIVAILTVALLITASPAQAKGHSTHHSYGKTHHKLTGTKQHRYLHATHRKHK